MSINSASLGEVDGDFVEIIIKELRQSGSFKEKVYSTSFFFET